MIQHSFYSVYKFACGQNTCLEEHGSKKNNFPVRKWNKNKFPLVSRLKILGNSGQPYSLKVSEVAWRGGGVHTAASSLNYATREKENRASEEEEEKEEEKEEQEGKGK